MTPIEIAAQRDALKGFATPHELRILDAVELTKTITHAAAAIGSSRTSVQTCLRNLAKRAAMRGWAPDHDMTRTVPDPFVVRGTSTLYGKDGEQKLQWVKSRLDDDRVRVAMIEASAALAESIPRLPAALAPRHNIAALCNQYTLTDGHIGMLAWHREGGADWDLKIAEAHLFGAFEAMIASAPAAGTAIVCQLGDWLHFDGFAPVTPTSNHVVDADSRYVKVVRAAIRILRRCIDLALEKHGRVIALVAEGNHDPVSSVWLREMFAAVYENEPRLTVITDELPFYAVQHGKTMLAYHHGHKKKPDTALGLLMAAQYPVMWGATKHRYVHVGHLHHVLERGEPGIRIVQHPTIAARDAYAARGGWLSERQAAAITYHDEFGEVARTIITPEMLQKGSAE